MNNFWKKAFSLISCLILLFSSAPLASSAPVITLKATPGCKEVTLSWNKIPEADYYWPYMIFEDGSEYPLIDFASKDLTFAHKDLEDGKEYCYIVKATDEKGKEITRSAKVCAKSDCTKEDENCIYRMEFVVGSKTYTRTLNPLGKKPPPKIVKGEMDSPPVIINSRTFMPAKYVVDNLRDATIQWDANTKEVTINAKVPDYGRPPKPPRKIVYKIGKNTVNVDGKEQPIDKTNSKIAPMIIAGRTMIPFRNLGENLGANVDYIPDEKRIILDFDCLSHPPDCCAYDITPEPTNPTTISKTEVNLDYVIANRSECTGENGLINFTIMADSPSLKLLVPCPPCPPPGGGKKLLDAPFTLKPGSTETLFIEFAPPTNAKEGELLTRYLTIKATDKNGKECSSQRYPVTLEYTEVSTNCDWTGKGRVIYMPSTGNIVGFDKNCDGVKDIEYVCDYTQLSENTKKMLARYEGCADFCIDPKTNKVIRWKELPNEDCCGTQTTENKVEIKAKVTGYCAGSTKITIKKDGQVVADGNVDSNGNFLSGCVLAKPGTYTVIPSNSTEFCWYYPDSVQVIFNAGDPDCLSHLVNFECLSGSGAPSNRMNAKIKTKITGDCAPGTTISITEISQNNQSGNQVVAIGNVDANGEFDPGCFLDCDRQYIVKPFKEGVVFSPQSHSIAFNNQTDCCPSFKTAVFQCSQGNNPLPNKARIVVKITGNCSLTSTVVKIVDTNGELATTGTVDANGNFDTGCELDCQKTYTITPYKTSLTFTPASLTVTFDGSNCCDDFKEVAFTCSSDQQPGPQPRIDCQKLIFRIKPEVKIAPLKLCPGEEVKIEYYELYNDTSNEQFTIISTSSSNSLRLVAPKTPLIIKPKQRVPLTFILIMPSDCSPDKNYAFSFVAETKECGKKEYSISVTCKDCAPNCDFGFFENRIGKFPETLCKGKSTTTTVTLINNHPTKNLELEIAGNQLTTVSPPSLVIKPKETGSFTVTFIMPDSCQQRSYNAQYTITPKGCQSLTKAFQINCDPCEVCCQVGIKLKTRIPENYSLCPGDKAEFVYTLTNQCPNDSVTASISSANVKFSQTQFNLSPGSSSDFTAYFVMPQCKVGESINMNFILKACGKETAQTLTIFCKDCATCCDFEMTELMTPKELCPGDKYDLKPLLKNSRCSKPVKFVITPGANVQINGSSSSFVTPIAIPAGGTMMFTVTYIMPSCKAGSNVNFSWTVKPENCEPKTITSTIACKSCTSCTTIDIKVTKVTTSRQGTTIEAGIKQSGQKDRLIALFDPFDKTGSSKMGPELCYKVCYNPAGGSQTTNDIISWSEIKCPLGSGANLNKFFINTISCF